ncbi:MAG: 2-dehydropantoate 2-reductase [Bdellovibrionales bacterium]|nr:2-dehydropantoate 2-reductase [Bdellovibrionales bacterium]
MHFGVVGLGPVGALFAAHLKKGGHRVSCLDAVAHKLEVLRRHPLRITGQLEATAQLSELYTDMGDFVATKPEVILFCVKSCTTREVARQMKAHGVDAKTIFVSCQNGIDVEEILAEVFGSNRTLRMILNFGVQFVNRSDVFVAFCYEQVLSAKKECQPWDKKIAEALTSAGLPIKVVENYKEEVFKKAILNSALGSVCALTRMTMKQVMEEPELVRMVRELLRESISVGETRGYHLREFFEPAVTYLSKGGDHKPSMLMDIERGHVTENEFHCGQMFRYAEEKKLDVPVIQTIYYLIKNLERAIILDTYVSKHYEVGG